MGEAKRAELAGTLGVAIIVLFIASVAMFYTEGPTQPDEFGSVAKCLWWATTALTTVDYGDVTPKSAPGKILASCVAFLGIGMFALPTSIVASGFQDVIADKQEEREDAILKLLVRMESMWQQKAQRDIELNATLLRIESRL